jgi:hypothetical protein
LFQLCLVFLGLKVDSFNFGLKFLGLGSVLLRQIDSFLELTFKDLVGPLFLAELFGQFRLGQRRWGGPLVVLEWW